MEIKDKMCLLKIMNSNVIKYHMELCDKMYSNRIDYTFNYSPGQSHANKVILKLLSAAVLSMEVGYIYQFKRMLHTNHMDNVLRPVYDVS
jgi:hypothetical protein